MLSEFNSSSRVVCDGPSWRVHCFIQSHREKKIFKGSSTPSEIEDKLKKASVDYTIEPLFDAQEGMLKLNVPGENLAMVLVQKQFCKEFINK